MEGKMVNQSKTLNHEEIRNTFLNFFESKNHKVLPSFSLIPENDPSLLFVAAGMVPFKAEFSGKIKPKYPRISTCQKCLRMDDIENVGYTLRHHTFFEMLGNFSFGDYFKQESIHWAYELLTQVYKIDPEKLYFSCHPDDDESEKIWLSLGIKPEKIVRLEDNFWGPVGSTGPCGPSTEIFYENFPCSNNCKPGYECPECKKKERFIEIWNIVFTQYFKEIDGKLYDLPQKNIDTGMGLERLTKILQNKQNQYLTDLFFPIIEFIQENIESNLEKVYSELKIKFDLNIYLQNQDIYKRIIADHFRGACFLIADGVVPSNDGRGYVLRKLIRRALLYSKLIGIKRNFSKYIPDIVESIFKNVYPEISQRKEFVKKILENEEISFHKNLLRGMEYLSKIQIKKLTGKDAFFLYDTLGFPIELTIEIAKSQNFSINIDEFYKELEIQKQKSKQKDTDIKVFSIKEKFSTEFVGYDNLSYQSKIIGIFKKENGKLIPLKYLEKNKYDLDEIIIISEQTPFYPESGGQVGDKGIIFNNNFSFLVKDTQKHVEGFIFHLGKLENGFAQIGEHIYLQVDSSYRKFTSINHTATHLLHSALKKILGHHVYQAGSLVDNSKLRFDFTHFDNLTEYDIKKIEELVNQKILESIEVEITYKPLNTALQEGAIALFAEKYPDIVRTVKINNFSYELCGGTHVKNTSQIGIFKILNYSSVQMGIKRIEAITSTKIIEHFEYINDKIQKLKILTKQEDKNLYGFVEKIINENKNLVKYIKELKTKLYSKIIEEKYKLNQINEVFHFDVDNEEDVMIIHDILKNKNNYAAIFNTNNKKIILFHKEKIEQIKSQIDIHSHKLIPFGQYLKIVI